MCRRMMSKINFNKTLPLFFIVFMLLLSLAVNIQLATTTTTSNNANNTNGTTSSSSVSPPTSSSPPPPPTTTVTSTTATVEANCSTSIKNNQIIITSAPPPFSTINSTTSTNIIPIRASSTPLLNSSSSQNVTSTVVSPPRGYLKERSIMDTINDDESSNDENDVPTTETESLKMSVGAFGSENNVGTTTKMIDGKIREKRDYVSDAVDRMKQAVANAQQQLQQQQGSNSNGAGVAALGVPSVNGGNTAVGLSDTQIIPIPPIDLSGKTQNIVFVSENGNVTLRRGQNFMSVETVMMPQQQQKN